MPAIPQTIEHTHARHLIQAQNLQYHLRIPKLLLVDNIAVAVPEEREVAAVVVGGDDSQEASFFEEDHLLYVFVVFYVLKVVDVNFLFGVGGEEDVVKGDDQNSVHQVFVIFDSDGCISGEVPSMFSL